MEKENKSFALELVKAHVAFWESYGSTIVSEKDGFIEGNSSRISDFYANFIEPLKTPSEPFFKSLLERFLKSKKPAAFSITPRSPDSWNEFLDAKDYTIASNDCYMVPENKESTQASLPKNIQIKAGHQELISDYLDVFLSVFGGTTSNENPYGGIEKGYIDATRETYANPARRHPIDNIVAYDGKKPVAIGSLIQNESIAGNYGIAVLPEYRGKGIAKAIMQKLSLLAPKHKHFLITEEGKQPYQIYLKLGWKPLFSTFIYTPKQEIPVP